MIEPKPTDAHKRMSIEVFDNEGTLVERSYGPTPEEMQEAHNEHRCGAFCPMCYDEAMATVCAKNEDTCDSIPPGSCGPDCHGFERKYK